jgi:hypothetical protein
MPQQRLLGLLGELKDQQTMTETRDFLAIGEQAEGMGMWHSSLPSVSELCATNSLCIRPQTNQS